MKYRYMAILSLIAPMALQGCGENGTGAAHIQLGTGNVITNLTDLQYQLPMVAQVTDLDGNAVEGSLVSFRVIPTEFHKGQYTVATQYIVVTAITCPAEDLDLDGVLDAGEDVNGNFILDPSNPATLTAHPSELPTLDPLTNKVTTDENGFAYFSITYPESVANWASVQVIASVSVSGTENTQTYDLRLPASLADMQNISVSPPGGSDSQYGIVADCASAN